MPVDDRRDRRDHHDPPPYDPSDRRDLGSRTSLRPAAWNGDAADAFGDWYGRVEIIARRQGYVAECVCTGIAASDLGTARQRGSRRRGAPSLAHPSQHRAPEPDT